MPEQDVFVGIYWSADVTDLGCTAHEADSCRSGWIDPGWDVFEVGPSRELNAVPDALPDDEDDPARWLAETVGARLGAPDGCHHTDRPGAWRAADPVIRDGMESILRAGAAGFTLAETEEANRILLGLGDEAPCC